MPINSIEVICIPCPKCERVKRMITEIIQAIETQNKTKIFYDFRHTPNLQEISKYSLNPSQTPAIIINGHAELAGQVEQLVLKNKLEALHKGY